MSKRHVWMNIVMVAVIALLVALPGAALAAPAPAPAPTTTAVSANAPAQWGGCWYRVRWGDTLAKIAYRRYTSVWYLRNINGLWNINRIWAGQWLRVPCARRW